MASWRIRFHDKWPHLASLYANSHNLDEEGKHPDPMMGQDNVFDPAEPLGAYRYYLAPTPRSEFSIEEPAYVNRSFYKDEESRSSGYTSGDSFRRGSTCRVLLCVFLVFSFIGAVVAAITLAVILSQQTKPKLVPAQPEYYESAASALGETFTQNLTDPTSKEYKALEEKFCKAINTRYYDEFTQKERRYTICLQEMSSKLQQIRTARLTRSETIEEMFTTNDSPVKHEFAGCEVIQFSNGSIRVTYRIKIQPGSPEGYKKSDKIEEKLLEHFIKKIGQTGPWRRIRWDPNFFRRFSKVEMTTVAPSTTTTTKPTKETTKPAKETTKPAKETTKPAKETTKPAKETTEPMKETTHPAIETTKPTKETTKPSKETTEPTEETTKPTKETTKPTKETIKPMKETTHPAKETTKPTNETTRPAKETSEPTEETTNPTKETTKATKETTEISISKTKATIQTEFYESTAKALGETFTENLTDPNSEEFRAMEEKFCKAIEEMFKTQDSPVGQAFAGCEVIEFSNGSVLVRYRLKLQPTEGLKENNNIEEKLLEHFVKKISQTGPWNTIKWDTKFLQQFLKLEITTIAPSSTTPTTLTKTSETSKPTVVEWKETTEILTDQTTTIASTIEASAGMTEGFTVETTSEYKVTKSTDAIESTEATDKKGTVSTKSVLTPEAATTIREENTTSSKPIQNITQATPAYSVVTDKTVDSTTTFAYDILDPFFNDTYWYYDNITSTEPPETENVTTQSDQITDKKSSHTMSLESTSAPAAENVTMTEEVKSSTVKEITFQHTTNVTDSEFQSLKTERVIKSTTAAEINATKLTTKIKTDENVTVMSTTPTVSETVSTTSESVLKSSTESFDILIMKEEAVIESQNWTRIISDKNVTVEPGVETTAKTPASTELPSSKRTHSSTAGGTSVTDSSTVPLITETDGVSLPVSVTTSTKTTIKDVSVMKQTTSKDTAAVEVTTTQGLITGPISTEMTSEALAITERETVITTAGFTEMVTSQAVSDVESTTEEIVGTTETDVVTQSTVNTLEDVIKSVTAAEQVTESTQQTEISSTELVKEDKSTKEVPTEKVATEAETSLVSEALTTTPFTESTVTEKAVTESTITERQETTKVKADISSTYKASPETTEEMLQEFTTQHSTVVARVTDALSTDRTVTAEKVVSSTDDTFVPSTTLQVDLQTTGSSVTSEPAIETENQTETSVLVTKTTAAEPSIYTSTSITEISTESATISTNSTLSGDIEMSTPSTSAQKTQTESATVDKTIKTMPSTVKVTESSTVTPHIVEEISSATESATDSEIKTVKPSTVIVTEVSTMTPQVGEESSSKIPETSTHIILETSTPVLTTVTETILDTDQSTTVAAIESEFTTRSGPIEDFTLSTATVEATERLTSEFQTSPTVIEHTPSTKVIGAVTEADEVTLADQLQNITSEAGVMTTVTTTPEKERTSDKFSTEKLSVFVQTVQTTTNAKITDFVSETVDQMTDTTPSQISPGTSPDKLEMAKILLETTSVSLENIVGADTAPVPPKTLATTKLAMTVTEKTELPVIKLADRFTDFTSALPTSEKETPSDTVTKMPSDNKTDIVETSSTPVPTKPVISELTFVSEEKSKTTEVKTTDLKSTIMTMTPIVITEKTTDILLEETMNTTERSYTTSVTGKTTPSSVEALPTQDTTTVHTEIAEAPEIIKTDTSEIFTTGKKFSPTYQSTPIVTEAAKVFLTPEGTSETPTEFKPTKTDTETQSTGKNHTTTMPSSTESKETTAAGMTETTTTQPDETTTAYDEFYMFYDNGTDYYDNYTDYTSTSTVSAEAEAVTEVTTPTPSVSAEAIMAKTKQATINQTVTSTVTKTTPVSDLQAHTTTMPDSVTPRTSSPVSSVAEKLPVVPSTVSIELATPIQKETPTLSTMEATSETTGTQAAIETSKISTSESKVISGSIKTVTAITGSSETAETVPPTISTETDSTERTTATEKSDLTSMKTEKESITRTTLPKPSNLTSVKIVSIIASEATMTFTNQTAVGDNETTTVIPTTETSTDNETYTTPSRVNRTSAEIIITDADNATTEYNETSTESPATTITYADNATAEYNKTGTESPTTASILDTETENITIDYNATATFDYYDNETLTYYYNETTTESYFDSTTEEILSNNTTGAQTSLVNTSPDSNMSSTISDQQTSTNADSTTSTSDTLL